MALALALALAMAMAMALALVMTIKIQEKKLWLTGLAFLLILSSQVIGLKTTNASMQCPSFEKYSKYMDSVGIKTIRYFAANSRYDGYYFLGGHIYIYNSCNEQVLFHELAHRWQEKRRQTISHTQTFCLAYQKVLNDLNASSTVFSFRDC
jgi:hypothetical protein